METITISAESDKIKALKAFLKAFEIPFTSKKEKEASPYNPEFVAKIKKAQQEVEKGNTITVDPENVWESILSK